jgi:hypothetical protein
MNKINKYNSSVTEEVPGVTGTSFYITFPILASDITNNLICLRRTLSELLP